VIVALVVALVVLALAGTALAASHHHHHHDTRTTTMANMKQDAIDALVAEYPEAKEQIAAMAGEHGEIAVVDTKSGIAIFRKPKPAEYERHLSLLFEEKTRPKAASYLARACVVYPSKEVFDGWLAEYPGIPLACTGSLTELAGAAKRERGKE
jgi:hypothetical protein